MPELFLALKHAVWVGSLEMVRLLLANSPFSTDDSSQHSNADFEGNRPSPDPLEMTLEKNQLNMAQLLDNIGADVKDRPLSWACAELDWNIDAVCLLLRAGTNVNRANISSLNTFNNSASDFWFRLLQAKCESLAASLIVCLDYTLARQRVNLSYLFWDAKR